MTDGKPVWQPIETAPRDFTTNIDIWANGKRVPDCFWGRPTYSNSKGYTWVHVDGYDSEGKVTSPVNNPTHWMPLPEPPEEA